MTERGLTILFWNIQKNPLAENIARLIVPYAVDIVLVAESPYWQDPTPLLQRLNRELNALPADQRGTPFAANAQELNHRRVQMFSRFGRSNWLLCADRRHYAVWRLITPEQNILLLATAHFLAPQSDEGDGQILTAGLLRRDLERIEPGYEGKSYRGKDQDEAYSMVIGDLNASPFDSGISGVYGLHATASRTEALKRSRSVEGEVYRYFYNPMWRFFGTGDTKDNHGEYFRKKGFQSMETVPGTYFHGKNRNSKPVWHGWYLLDQVLIRPSLLPYFDEQRLLIPRSDGIIPFVSEGERRPNLSDHLPIICHVEI